MSVLLRVARLPELLYTVLRDKRLIKKSCNFASCSFLRSVLIKDKLNGKAQFLYLHPQIKCNPNNNSDNANPNSVWH
jgi:hypothetical protein